MTRKDFELIARILRSKKPSHDRKDGLLWVEIVEAFRKELYTANDKFDGTLFERACYVE